MKIQLVWNAQAEEGIAFSSKVDAKYAATGLNTSLMGVSSLASDWRDTYAQDEPERIFPIIEIDVDIPA